MEWYLKAFKRYFDFKGRSRRKEYWMFFLINLVMISILVTINYLVIEILRSPETVKNIVFAISSLYLLVVLIPSIGVTVRRLQDTGYSGWYLVIPILCGFIPFVGGYLSSVGGFIVLRQLVTDSEEGHNSWGANPKENTGEMVEQLV